MLEKYNKDKVTASNPIECLCKLNSDCKKNHDNLYERVYCELSTYASINTGKIKDKKPIYEYNSRKHIEIMNLIDAIFKGNLVLDDWNVYIEKLITSIKQGKNIEDVCVKKGGRFKLTRRKSRC